MNVIRKYLTVILSITCYFNNGNTIENSNNESNTSNILSSTNSTINVIDNIEYDINSQNNVIHNKIKKKIVMAQQQLSAVPDDNELVDYIQYLKKLQTVPNISQKLSYNELMHFF